MSKKPDLHKRYRAYLAQHKLGVDFTVDEETWIPLGKLKSLALGRGYPIRDVQRAIAALKEDVDIAVVWDRKHRVERYCFIPMTEEEKAAHIADKEWFDSLD